MTELRTETLEPVRVQLSRLFAGARLTPAQRRIANYVIEHGPDVAFLSSTQLAEEVGVSQPSVTRFAAALGFAGFAEMQQSLRDVVLSGRAPTGEATDNKMQRAIRQSTQDLLALHDLMSDLAPLLDAAKLLASSESAVIYGHRASRALATHLAYFAEKILPRARLITHSGSVAFDQLTQAQLDGATVLVAVVLPRYPREALAVLDFARELQLSVVVITDSVTAVPAKHADIVLVAPVNPHLVFDAAVAPLQLIVCLLEAIADAKAGRTQQRLVELETVAAKRRTYVAH